MTPQTRRSVDYSSTRGIQVDVGLPDTIFRKSGRVSFVWRALPKYNTCIYLSQTVQYISNHYKKFNNLRRNYFAAKRLILLQKIVYNECIFVSRTLPYPRCEKFLQQIKYFVYNNLLRQNLSVVSNNIC